MERLACEQRDHADQSIGHEQGIARKCDHPFTGSPFLVTDARTADDVVREVRRPLLRDEPYLEFADRHTTMRTVEVRVHSGTRLKLEDRLRLAEGPDAGKRGAEVAHDRFRALLESGDQRLVRRQDRSHLGLERKQPDPFAGRILACTKGTCLRVL